MQGRFYYQPDYKPSPCCVVLQTCRPQSCAMLPAQVHGRQPLAVINLNQNLSPNPAIITLPQNAISSRPHPLQLKKPAIVTLPVQQNATSRPHPLQLKKPAIVTLPVQQNALPVQQNATSRPHPLQLKKPAIVTLPVQQNVTSRPHPLQLKKPAIVTLPVQQNATSRPHPLQLKKPAIVTLPVQQNALPVQQNATSRPHPLQLKKPAIVTLPVQQIATRPGKPATVPFASTSEKHAHSNTSASAARPSVLSSANKTDVATYPRRVPLLQQNARPPMQHPKAAFCKLPVQQITRPLLKCGNPTTVLPSGSISFDSTSGKFALDTTKHPCVETVSDVTTIECFIPDLIGSRPLAKTPKKLPNLSNPENHTDLQAILEKTLPTDYQHKILSVDSFKVYGEGVDQNEMFQAVIRLDIRNKADALDWLEDYHMSSSTDWRVRRTFKENSPKIIFKKQFRCHNTHAQYRPETKKAHYKQTECKASITITIKKFGMKWSDDILLKTHPLEIIIDHCHNHPLSAADSLRHRRPNPDVKEIFLGMFKSGHSPSSALRTYQYDLQVKYGEEFWRVLGDGALCPNDQWCFYQYYKQFGEAYGAPDGSGMVASLQKAIETYNADCGSTCASMKQIGKDIVVVLCTPLMKRVHENLKSSAEMVFLDSGGMMDRQNTRIFTFLASSVAGALPLGMVMTSSESQAVISEGMSLLKTIFPPNAFFGRGEKGPVIAMTDDSTSERNSLRDIYPDMILLLCFFHILQAYWRYLLESKHKVPEEHRLEVFFLFKQWCRCESVEEFEELYASQLAHPVIANNKFVKKHLQDMYVRAPEWAFCYRQELLTRGNETDNYSEITIRNYKDVLDRLKAYSEVQLFDFFITRIEAYWERRIATVVNNRRLNYSRSKHFIRPEKLVPLHCTKSLRYEGIYIVKNVESGGKYTVDTDLEICNCPVGKQGAPCKHQMAVVKEFGLSSTQFLPFDDEEAKMTLHKIMTTLSPPPGWYASLKGGPCTQVAQDQSIQEPVQGQTDSRSSLADESLEQSNADEPAVDEDKRAAAIDLWNTSVQDYVMWGLQNRPDVFISAVERFSQHFDRFKKQSENALLSQMHTFGKYDSLSAKACRKGKYINVNGAAIRRRLNAVGGRKCAPQGRPPKTMYTAEHGYSVQRGAKRSAALPHCLMHRIE